MENQVLRKITVSAEACRRPNPQDKDEQLLPENSYIFCGRVLTFVYAKTYAEAIEIGKKKIDEHFKDSEYITNQYGAHNYDAEYDEENKKYQIFVP